MTLEKRHDLITVLKPHFLPIGIRFTFFFLIVIFMKAVVNFFPNFFLVPRQVSEKVSSVVLRHLIALLFTNRQMIACSVHTKGNTAHVPNFDFLTGCREFKRCVWYYRTFKNPFASCLVEFDTTLNLRRITDQ